MPIGQIKALSWLFAAILTLGLSAYVFTFITELKQRDEQGLIAPAEIKAALEDVPPVAEQKEDVIDYQEVRRLFHEGQLNWTGYKAPPPPPPTPNGGVVDEKPKYKPIAELLNVLMIKYDPVDEARSVAWIHYTPDARVVPAPVVKGYSLRVGDALAKPHDHVQVKAIGPHPETGRLEVLFSFRDEGRAPESVGTEQFKASTSIVQVDDVTGLRLNTPKSFPIGTVERPRRGKTREISPNNFKLGTEDLEVIEQEYPKFINEIRPHRHRDPRTGRYDGIEISDVPSGSMAARHGAESGDVIKSINGQAVTSVPEAVAFAKNNADKYDKWEIVIERRGKELTITYTPD